MGTIQSICNVTKNDTFLSDYFISFEKLAKGENAFVCVLSK